MVGGGDFRWFALFWRGGGRGERASGSSLSLSLSLGAPPPFGDLFFFAATGVLLSVLSVCLSLSLNPPPPPPMFGRRTQPNPTHPFTCPPPSCRRPRCCRRCAPSRACSLYFCRSLLLDGGRLFVARARRPARGSSRVELVELSVVVFVSAERLAREGRVQRRKQGERASSPFFARGGGPAAAARRRPRSQKAGSRATPPPSLTQLHTHDEETPFSLRKQAKRTQPPPSPRSRQKRERTTLGVPPLPPKTTETTEWPPPPPATGWASSPTSCSRR
jgi:hypothetical protein